jgi:uncharacterized Rmd1/YagE family protein
MNKILQDNNYLLIDNFISHEKALNLYNQFKEDIKSNPELFNYDPQCPKSLAIYDYRPFLELLIEKISFMSEIMGEPMFPTYCYSRLYKNDEVLEKHKDRNSCEVSVTLNLGGDKDWDIFFTKPNGDIVSCNLKPGQAVIYLGIISEHWRNAFEGQEYGQVFLHYVKAKGENWIYYFDKFKG